MKKSQTFVLLLLLFGSIGCGRSESNPEENLSSEKSSSEKSTSIQSKVVTSAPSKPTENTPSTPTENSPSKPTENTPSKPTENARSTPTENDRKSPESPGENTPQSTPQTAETPEPDSPTPSPSDPPLETPNKPDRDPIPTEYNFKTDEEPIVPVGNFEFQLKQASLKKELVDPSTQKNYSTKSAEKPSYYLFVELDLTNRSDRTAFDLFRYQLDCGDGKPLKNAADAAVAYRSNKNLNVFAEIQPGETETVADGFLVPESCLNSDDMTLNISSAGEGEGKIPVRLKD